MKEIDLFRAVQNGDTEKVSALLDSGAFPNVLDNEDCTALMLAAGQGHIEIVKILLGAIKNLDGQYGITSEATLLVQVRDAENKKRLVKAGKDINVQNNAGGTALMFAVYNGHVEITKMLLDAGSNLDVQDNKGNTALMLAVQVNNTEIVKMLLGAGANLNMQDNNGSTALMWPAVRSQVEIVKMLLEAGMNPNVKNLGDFTALTMVAETGNAEMAKILLDCGANPTIENKSGDDAWYFAKQYPTVLTVFEEYQRKIDSGWQPKPCKHA